MPTTRPASAATSSQLIAAASSASAFVATNNHGGGWGAGSLLPPAVSAGGQQRHSHSNDEGKNASIESNSTIESGGSAIALAATLVDSLLGPAALAAAIAAPPAAVVHCCTLVDTTDSRLALKENARSTSRSPVSVLEGPGYCPDGGPPGLGSGGGTSAPSSGGENDLFSPVAQTAPFHPGSMSPRSKAARSARQRRKAVMQEAARRRAEEARRKEVLEARRKYDEREIARRRPGGDAKTLGEWKEREAMRKEWEKERETKKKERERQDTEDVTLAELANRKEGEEAKRMERERKKLELRLATDSILTGLPGGIRNSVVLFKSRLFCDVIDMGGGDAFHCTLLPPDHMQKMQTSKIVGEGASGEANAWWSDLFEKERDRFRDLDGRLCVMSYWLLQQHGFDFDRNPFGKRRHNDAKKLCYICTDAARCLQHFLDTKGDCNVHVLYLIRLANADVKASGGRHVSLHTDVSGQEDSASFGAAKVAIPVLDVYKVDRTTCPPTCTLVVKDGEPIE